MSSSRAIGEVVAHMKIATRTAILSLALLAVAACFAFPRWSAARDWRDARAAAERRDFDGALASLDRVRSMWPDDREVALFAARTLRRAGKFADADAALGRCRAVGVPAEDVRLESNLLAAQRGDTLRVETHLIPLLKPHRPEFLLVAEVLSAEWMRQNRLSDALRALDPWVATRPEAEAFVRRGWVHERLMHAEQSVADYRKALELDPTRRPIRLRLAELFLGMTQADDAKPYLDALQSESPDEPAVRLAWARYHRMKGDFDAATAILDALLAEASPPSEAFSERGALALDLAEPGAAEPLLREATRRRPHDRQAHYALVQCLTKLNRPEEAARVAKEITRIDVDRKRLQELMEEVERKPRDVDLRAEVGGIFARNGHPEDARRWFRAALEIDPTHRAATEGLAALKE